MGFSCQQIRILRINTWNSVYISAQRIMDNLLVNVHNCVRLKATKLRIMLVFNGGIALASICAQMQLQLSKQDSKNCRFSSLVSVRVCVCMPFYVHSQQERFNPHIRSLLNLTFYHAHIQLIKPIRINLLQLQMFYHQLHTHYSHLCVLRTHRMRAGFV